jgi:Na+:H+ antiporter, NhaA family
MPLFAFANAGVSFGGLSRTGDTKIVMAGILLGLVVGKPLGVVVACAASIRLGICALPRGVGWGGVLMVGLVAGIGFTMAIFVSGLAFEDPPTLAAAKLAVLIGSLVAGLGTLAIGKRMLPAP